MIFKGGHIIIIFNLLTIIFLVGLSVDNESTEVILFS
jgi:hypothetical protein